MNEVRKHSRGSLEEAPRGVGRQPSPRGRDGSWTWKDGKGYERKVRERRLGGSGTRPMGCLDAGQRSLGSPFRLHLSSPVWPWGQHTHSPALSHPTYQMQPMGWTRCCRRGSLHRSQTSDALSLAVPSNRLTSQIRRGKIFMQPASFNNVKFRQQRVHTSGTSNWAGPSCSCSHRPCRMPQSPPLPTASPIAEGEC